MEIETLIPIREGRREGGKMEENRVTWDARNRNPRDWEDGIGESGGASGGGDWWVGGQVRGILTTFSNGGGRIGNY